MRLLLVEDTAIVANELKRALEREGCELVQHCDCLDSALDAARADTTYAGALLDINLRGQLVYPAAQELLNRGIPIIFLTGYASEFLPAPFGACSMLEKPFTAASLRSMMLKTFAAHPA
jgi:DNA-binding response OmpR family regulator